MQLLMTFAHKSSLDVHVPVQVKNLNLPFSKGSVTFLSAANQTKNHVIPHPEPCDASVENFRTGRKECLQSKENLRKRGNLCYTSSKGNRYGN